MRRHLQIGVVGLGARWPRFSRAIARMHGRIEVRAVWDATPAATEAAARQAGCQPAAGLLELLERGDVQALLFLEAPWHGFWGVEQAARLGKPVCCVASLLDEEPRLEEVRRRVGPSASSILVASSFHLHPLLVELRRMAAEQLGEPHLLRGELVLPGPAPHGDEPRSALLGPGVQRWLLGWLLLCRDLFGADLRGLTLQAPPGAGLGTLLLEFDGGRTSLLTLIRRPGTARRCAVELLAERGPVRATWPRRITWRDGLGDHLVRLPRVSASQMILWHFSEALHAGNALEPSFATACQVVPWLQAARHSLAHGTRWVPHGAA